MSKEIYKSIRGAFKGHPLLSIFPADRAEPLKGDRPIVAVGLRKARALEAASQAGDLRAFIAWATAQAQAQAPEARRPQADVQEDIGDDDAEPVQPRRKARKAR